MKFRSIRTKLLFFSLGGTMLLAVCFTILVYSDYKKNLTDELGRRGHILALGISSSVQKALLTGNLARIKHIVDHYKGLDPDIVYVVIEDNSGKIVYHTFEGGFPRDLRNLLADSGDRDTMMYTEAGLVRNIPSSIFGGEAGVAHIGLSEERVRSQMRNNLRVILLTVFVVGGAGVLVITYLSRSVTGPIDDVILAAKHFGAGEYGHRIRVGASDETGRLATAFNRMAGEISEHQRRILQAEKLAAVGRLSLGIAHEINNPLMGIKNACAFIKNEGRLEGKPAEYMELIADGLEKIEGIVRGLLASSREKGTEPREFSLNEVIEKSLELVAPLLDRKSVAVEKNVPEHAGVFGRPDRLQQVLLNLLLNAIDAVSSGGRIRLGAAAGDGTKLARITVADNGPGIGREEIGNIFEPFFTTKESGVGTGLGLYVCHQIMREMNGRIEVRSEPGEGAEFTVYVPTVPPEAGS